MTDPIEGARGGLSLRGATREPTVSGAPAPPRMSAAALAEAQLAAYLVGDLDGFCACYADDVRVIGESGEVELEGMERFRARYASLFARGGYGATVNGRLFLAEHCVDLEHWWRVDPETGARFEGTALIRYSVVDGKIAVVQFLR
ncbi:MAG: nuclear transport factor 2 family protein [Deltaproteobacteria bacterium]|nr:nuclear transport factor 2 family protein [Deltaproteobacteria bacterium]